MSSPWQLEGTSTTAVSLSLPFSPLLAFHIGCVVGGRWWPKRSHLVCPELCWGPVAPGEAGGSPNHPAAQPALSSCFPSELQGKISQRRERGKPPPQILPKNEIWQSYPVPLCAKLSRTPFVKELWGTSGIRRKIVKFCCGRDELIFTSAICPSHGSMLSSVCTVSLHGPQFT